MTQRALHFRQTKEKYQSIIWGRYGNDNDNDNGVFVMPDISAQSSAQGTAVGCRSALIGSRQTHPHNMEPE